MNYERVLLRAVLREGDMDNQPTYKAILGFMGLVMCPKCHGSGHIIVPPYDPHSSVYTCIECMGTGKIAKQFTLEELHNELNEISLKARLLERK